MIKIDMRAVEDSLNEMQNHMTQIVKLIYELEEVSNGLRQLSDMEGVNRRIKREVEELEERKRTMYRMYCTLQECKSLYGNTEENILECIEDSKIKPLQTMVWNDLPVHTEQNKLIKELIIW